MNLAVMRAERMVDSVHAFVDEHGTTQWFDQDALNVVYAGRWYELDPRWNAQNSFWFWPDLANEVLGDTERARAIARPGILHFEGPTVVKPWHYLCQHPHRHAYRAMLRETPWRDTALEERTVVTRMIRLLPTTAQLQAYARWQRLRARRAVAS
jgi:lipopolysaccharide biosynthesis glycosyltransferase